MDPIIDTVLETIEIDLETACLEAARTLRAVHANPRDRLLFAEAQEQALAQINRVLEERAFGVVDATGQIILAAYVAGLEAGRLRAHEAAVEAEL